MLADAPEGRGDVAARAKSPHDITSENIKAVPLKVSESIKAVPLKVSKQKQGSTVPGKVVLLKVQAVLKAEQDVWN